MIVTVLQLIKHRAPSLLRGMVVLSVCLLTSEDVLATDFVSRSQELKFGWDRTTVPSYINIYMNETIASDPESTRYSQVHFVCSSDSDAANGVCVVGGRKLSLRFTERRSRISFDLVADGYMKRTWIGTVCEGYQSQAISINTPQAYACDATGKPRNTGSNLTLQFMKAELGRLPTGGIWDAELVLLGKPYASATPGAIRWVSRITINLTDKANIQAYLPRFPTGKARVDLNLRAQPLPAAGSRVTGLATIDLCLYDGYNSNSSSFQLTFKDALPRGGRLPEQFSVVRKADPSSPAPDQNNPSDRIDYTVEMSGPALGSGKPGVRPLVNGETFTMTSIGDANIRAVRIPQVITPVVCTPTPLTLTAVPFNQLDKRAGHYEGTLSVVFTPSSESL